jgi:outer membrane protein assembly factor BamB
MPRSRAIRIALAAALLLGGCSGLKIPRSLMLRPGDWPMFAGSGAHINASPVTVTPPLIRVWDYDMTAGAGNGSPLIVDSVLFIGNLRGELHAVNALTGSRIGWVNLGEAIQGSPVVDGSTAFVALSNTRESLLAYDLLSGKATWRKTYGDIETSLLLVGRRLYFGTTAGVLHCVEAGSGEPAWKFELPGNTALKGIRSSPASGDTLIVAGADDGTVYAWSAASGAVRWKFPGRHPVAASPVIARGAVYAATVDGVLHALDLESGKERWSWHAAAPVYGGVTLNDSLVFVATVGGTMTAIRTADGTPAWTTSVEGPVNAAPLLAGSVLYTGTLRKRLCALRATDGALLWSTEVEGRIKTSPATALRRIYVATDNQEVLCFKEAQP